MSPTRQTDFALPHVKLDLDTEFLLVLLVLNLTGQAIRAKIDPNATLVILFRHNLRVVTISVSINGLTPSEKPTK